jgi:hypothetical protein
MASEQLIREEMRNRKEVDSRIVEQVKKAERLKGLGFTNSKEISIADKVKKGQSQKSFATYYKKKYPFLKFITEEQLNHICNKYGLVYSIAPNYTGNIPDKNLDEIERAKIDTKDYVDWPQESVRLKELDREFEIEKHTTDDIYSKERILKEDSLIRRDYSREVAMCYDRRTNLYIVAPQHLFKSSERTGNELRNKELKDPIVFRWCRGGLLIISKWGDEADDPILTVPELN